MTYQKSGQRDTERGGGITHLAPNSIVVISSSENKYARGNVDVFTLHE